MTKPFLTFADTLQALSRLTDYERMARHGTGYRRLSLEPIQALLARLDDPQLAFPAIHVTGTKGKGSTATIAAALLERVRGPVGLYTSPHLERLTERIRVSGREISESEWIAGINRLRPAWEEAAATPVDTDRPTFFDVVTALALLHFRDRAVSAGVVEVGLGGRLDSTNVVNTRVAVITNVTIDHTETLGASPAEIARQKSGIIRGPVTVVTGVPPVTPASGELEAVVRARGARLLRMGYDVRVSRFSPELTPRGPSGLRFTAGLPSKREIGDVRLRLLGRHQAVNAALALAACEAFLGGEIPLDDDSIRQTLESVRIPGRAELFEGEPDVLLDGAHNEASMLALRELLDDFFPARPVVLLFGASKDKDVEGMLRMIRPRVTATVFTATRSARAASCDDLRALGKKAGLRSEAAADSREGLARARAVATEKRALVVVAGSLYLVGEVRTGFGESTESGGEG